MDKETAQRMKQTFIVANTITELCDGLDFYSILAAMAKVLSNLCIQNDLDPDNAIFVMGGLTKDLIEAGKDPAPEYVEIG